LSRVGGITAFAAEASLWLAGAAIVAGAAGAHWSMPSLPTVDLGSLVAQTSPGASTAPGGSPGASDGLTVASPGTSSGPGASPATILARYEADTHSASFQFSATYTQALTIHTADGTVKLTATGWGAGAGGDCSEGWATSDLRYDDLVLVGSNSYERIDNGAWTQSARQQGGTCEMVGLFRYTGLVDKGLQPKNGAQLHRLEVSDPVQFGSDYEKFESKATGQTATQATLVVWVKDDGSPVALQISASYNATVNGLPGTVLDSRDYVVTKLSGVTITAPKI
jgi:hypothetical protein